MLTQPTAAEIALRHRQIGAHVLAVIRLSIEARIADVSLRWANFRMVSRSSFDRPALISRAMDRTTALAQLRTTPA